MNQIIKPMLLAVVWCCCACNKSGSTDSNDTSSDTDADTDSDSDTDVDSDTDSDSDTDTDSDSDTDVDTDSDSDTDTSECLTDAECTYGEQWCVEGTCEECDNDGLDCLLDCMPGWHLYERNGCYPCSCAPNNECTSDADCIELFGPGTHCYAGLFCWDWCPPEDPSCCFGNTCSLTGCTEPSPVGCWTTGCPLDQTCVDDGCESSGCDCDGESAFWLCLPDCGGGVCI